MAATREQLEALVGDFEEQIRGHRDDLVALDGAKQAIRHVLGLYYGEKKDADNQVREGVGESEDSASGEGRRQDN